MTVQMCRQVVVTMTSVGLSAYKHRASVVHAMTYMDSIFSKVQTSRTTFNLDRLCIAATVVCDVCGKKSVHMAVSDPNYAKMLLTPRLTCLDSFTALWLGLHCFQLQLLMFCKAWLLGC